VHTFLRLGGCALLLCLARVGPCLTADASPPGVTSEGAASTYFVDAARGSDAYSGRLAEANASQVDGPLQTIQVAYEKLQPGDSLYIKKGVYRETVLLTKTASRFSPIVIQAFPGDEGQVVISGADPLRNWRRCPSRQVCGGNPHWRNIFMIEAAQRAEIKQLFQYGFRLKLSRYPDQGWLYPTAVDPNESTLAFRDAGLQDKQTHWTGSTCNVKTALWHLDQTRVSAYAKDDGKITLASPTRFGMSSQTGYYFTNLISEINEEGEWAFDHVHGRVYLWPWGEGPEDVEGTGREYGIDSDHCSYHTVRGLTVRQAIHGIRLYQTEHMDVQENTVDYAYAVGIFDTGASASSITGNKISYSGHIGIMQDEFCTDGLLEGNHVYATGAEFLGDDLLNGDALGMGVAGNRARVINNRIDRSGSHGLYAARGDTAGREIAYNYITNACLSLADAAGIYTDGHSSASEPDVFHHNIVADIWGWQGGWAGCETSDGEDCMAEVYGIYLDEQGNNRIFTHNTVIGCATAGVFFHWTQGNWLAHNTFYGNVAFQVLLSGKDDPRFALRDNVVRENLLIATRPSQRTLQLNRDYSSIDFGDSDENRFYHPKSSRHIAVCDDLGGSTCATYSLAQWHEMSGKDDNSKDLLPAQGPGRMAVIFTNPHMHTITVDLEGRDHVDINGRRVEDKAPLEPFESIVLFPLSDEE